MCGAPKISNFGSGRRDVQKLTTFPIGEMGEIGARKAERIITNNNKQQENNRAFAGDAVAAARALIII